MNVFSQNTLAVVAGIVAGSAVNMALVSFGQVVIPLPEGADVSTVEKMGESIKLFEPIHFLFPFLAHALGTLAGAFLAARLAAGHALKFAVVIGAVFLAGGITAVVLFGGPSWFAATDLILAYLPMGYLGGVLGRPKRS